MATTTVAVPDDVGGTKAAAGGYRYSSRVFHISLYENTFGINCNGTEQGCSRGVIRQAVFGGRPESEDAGAI